MRSPDFAAPLALSIAALKAAEDSFVFGHDDYAYLSRSDTRTRARVERELRELFRRRRAARRGDRP